MAEEGFFYVVCIWGRESFVRFSGGGGTIRGTKVARFLRLCIRMNTTFCVCPRALCHRRTIDLSYASLPTEPVSRGLLF